ncbi:MAG TPA: hypothetical protein VK416_11360 [Thermoanaerobaculia bacterium]|nr:hypothetical protein [Thermoanaerobaculia bacterium]
MRTVVGIFSSPAAAQRATRDLVNAGVPPARIRQLTPGSPEREIHSAIPTTETEQPGMGKAVGAVVGGVVGLTLALGLSAVLQGGMGALGLTAWIIAALCAIVGAGIGFIAGGVLDERLSTGLPKDEIYFYEEALRKGRSVVFAFAAGGRQEATARRVLDRAGANSLDAGDESWSVGLSPARVHNRTTGRRAS